MKLTRAAANRAIVLGERQNAPVVLNVYAGPTIACVNTPSLTQHEAQAARRALIHGETSLHELQERFPGVSPAVIAMQVGWSSMRFASAAAKRYATRLPKRARRDGLH